MKVPFVDLDAQYQSIKPEILKSIESVLDSKQFIQGKICEEFAARFLEVQGGQYGVGCSNGTSAITLALRALNIGTGDEVITVTNTFFATVEAIAEVGATPVLVDCTEDNYLMNLQEVENKITDKTKAIIPVHLYGNPVNMEALASLAKQKGLFIIEDCAQAHLAQYNGQAVATFGEFGTFSFYPGKNLGAYGDAGFIIAKNEELKKIAYMYLDHGRTQKYEHDLLAGNYRMDGIQAAVLSVKCQYIKDWTEKRIKAAAYYDSNLKPAGFKVIEVPEQSKCVYHLYVVEVSNRDEVMAHLNESGVSCGIHYPIALHMQPALKHLGHKEGDFPVAEKTSKRIVSLPIFPELTREQQDYVLESFLKVAKI